jgi:transposase
MQTRPTPLKAAVASPREIAWWFCLPTDRLAQKQREQLQILSKADSELSSLYDLAQAFFRLLREHSSSLLEPWMEYALASQTSELRGFARGLGRDEATVRAGLASPWRQGPVEGHVHRLMLPKRQAHGLRASDVAQADAAARLERLLEGGPIPNHQLFGRARML